MSDRKFIVIGLSDSREQRFSDEILAIIRNGKIFSGGKRHHEIVADLLPGESEWLDITVPLPAVYERYGGHREIVVFSSGDPLFYGFAATLAREFPDAIIDVYPSFNSLQLLAHRLSLPYGGMENVSVTGRPWKNLDVALMKGRELIGLLTDRRKGPAETASRMLSYGYDNYWISVGESLGNEHERVRTITLEEAADTVFSVPNCVILKMREPKKRYFGVPESLFSHLEGRGNMITKMPVRLMSLAMLDLPGKSVMWDVGFCTGSVSIEAQLHFPELQIISFERREESRKLLEENCRRFGAAGIVGVIEDFMDCDLSEYPAPDAVFIGGHGGRLDEMTRRIFERLNPGGVVVFNSVSGQSCRAFEEAVESCRHKIVESHLIQLDTHNPITIMKAI